MSEEEKLAAILELSHENYRLLSLVLLTLLELTARLNRIEGFVISQEESPMLAIAPGNSPVFTATPVPSTSVPSTPPTWATSDSVNAPIAVDLTGLIVTVAIPATATVGAAFTLTISYTNADSTAATGSITETIVAAPSPDITSFTIAQTT